MLKVHSARSGQQRSVQKDDAKGGTIIKRRARRSELEFSSGSKKL
jgi:hypothetical protein